MDRSSIRILFAFEHTGSLSQEFSKLGFDVTTCDLKKSLSPGNHIQADFFSLDHSFWHCIIAFYPCTYLAKAGLSWCNIVPGRTKLKNQAIRDVEWIFSLPNQFIAVENPIGALNTEFKLPSQIIQPWHFGDPYRKEICLWLKGLPGLMSSAHNTVRRHPHNHVNGRMSQALKSEIKSSWQYYPKMCKAIAEQWGFAIIKDMSSGEAVSRTNHKIELA